MQDQEHKAQGEVTHIHIEDEMKSSYLDYAMSVITGRALPDARDGLKPVHRRVLFAMHQLDNVHNKPHKKSARVVGDVIGKYHPHGDTAVYDTIVRMAQPFAMRHTLVDGQGNFGSIDGDSAAAMRYTEIRMAPIAKTLLTDLEKDTVDWVPNYDGTEMIPDVLPAAIPNLLINGSSGIAVGMATNIPPHNLDEVLAGTLALLDDETLTNDQLAEYIPGPDFPTGGSIHGRHGILDGYRYGRGSLVIRAKAHIEPVPDSRTGRQQLVFTELPYQINKVRVIEKIVELVKDKKIEGISTIRDESDKDGIRLVIELKIGEYPEAILNQLYQRTQLQTNFGMNMMALVDGVPRMLDLRMALSTFLQHRKAVVVRRSVFERQKLLERGNVVEGLMVAMSAIDKVIEIVRKAPNRVTAEMELCSIQWTSPAMNELIRGTGNRFKLDSTRFEKAGFKDEGYYLLTKDQAKAILDMRLSSLVAMEFEKLNSEYLQIIAEVERLTNVIEIPSACKAVIRDELVLVKFEYGQPRRSPIYEMPVDINDIDLVPKEERIVTISHLGYAKSQALSEYQAQRRGGKGKAATGVKDEDYVTQLLTANSHTQLLLFSTAGKAYGLRCYEIPEASRTARGRPLNNMLPLAAGERITTVLPVEAFTEGHFVFMAMASGTVKKTALTAFGNIRSQGLIATNLDEGDTLISAAITTGDCEIMLFADNGRATRFKEYDVREMGRTARGVRGMRLNEDQRLISMIIPPVPEEQDKQHILTVSERGYGKRTPVSMWPMYNRGGSGVISMGTNDRNGRMVAAVLTHPEEDVMLITNQGTLVRTHADSISISSRNTLGVSLIRVHADETLVSVEVIKDGEDDDGGNEEDPKQ